MKCLTIPQEDEYKELIYKEAISNRIPINGTFELTFGCNLDCIHCYTSCNRTLNDLKNELSYGEICNIKS
mgnify:CR=1 FL=1